MLFRSKHGREVVVLGRTEPARRRRRQKKHHQLCSLTSRRGRGRSRRPPTHIPQQAYADAGGDGDATTRGPRTRIPKHEADDVATPTTEGRIHGSIAGASSADERKPDPGRTPGRTRPRRLHQDAAVGHTYPLPIYNPAAQIRSSPTPPAPQRTEEERGATGGAGRTGGTRESPSHSPLCTVEGGGGGEKS